MQSNCLKEASLPDSATLPCARGIQQRLYRVLKSAKTEHLEKNELKNPEKIAKKNFT
jgi:hypothetical protein